MRLDGEAVAVAVERESDTVKYAQDRLSEWAAWTRNMNGVRLGYPTHAAFLSERCGDSDAPIDDSGNVRAQEVEDIMCKMRGVRPSLHEALIQWYLLQKPAPECARCCGCSERVWRDRVRQGEMFIAGRLLG